MALPHAFPPLEPPEPRNRTDNAAPHCLPPRILAAVRREAETSRADDWATFAQEKLDHELQACSILLSDKQVLLLHRYAAVLSVDPQELLGTLLAPEAARRERLWRQVKALARAHTLHWAPRQGRGRGCPAFAVWPTALVGFWTLACALVQWALSLLPLLLHR
jgi:hypothetical protein